MFISFQLLATILDLLKTYNLQNCQKYSRNILFIWWLIFNTKQTTAACFLFYDIFKVNLSSLMLSQKWKFGLHFVLSGRLGQLGDCLGSKCGTVHYIMV